MHPIMIKQVGWGPFGTWNVVFISLLVPDNNNIFNFDLLYFEFFFFFLNLTF